ncbi:hypothetical protein D3C78_1881180 [compost metagenome]
MLDQCRAARNVPAATGQGLAQRSHPDVDVIASQPIVLANSFARRTHHPQRMSFIHHEENLVLMLELDEPG